jgi:class 3 adenylate cyclase
MGVVPQGTVTFLFTDVESSTRLWEQDGEGMRLALAAHDRILRAAIEAQDGYVFSTAGDAFSAAFSTPGQAVVAAVEAQRRLGAESWPVALRVRMGVHTGTAEEREGDYFGPAVNRAARVMSAGHGGQVLLSLVTEELVRDRLPDGVSLVGLGGTT